MVRTFINGSNTNGNVLFFKYNRMIIKECFDTIQELDEFVGKHYLSIISIQEATIKVHSDLRLPNGVLHKYDKAVVQLFFRTDDPDLIKKYTNPKPIAPKEPELMIDGMTEGEWMYRQEKSIWWRLTNKPKRTTTWQED